MQNTKDSDLTLNADLQFLVNCCKTNPTKEDINSILSYLNAQHLDLNALIGLANQHGILPLVYKTLKKLSSSDNILNAARSGNALGVQRLTLNAEILTELKAHYMIIAQRNILMSAELIRIIQLLEKNSIEAIAFKGPALSQMVYGDITLRQYADLDILVKKEDIYKVDALLKDLGYHRVYRLTPEQEKIWMKFKHDLGLYHPKKGVHFEVHWSLMDEDYPMQIDLVSIWEDPQTIKLNQQEIGTFPTEELLLYLCIHGSKHLWERIEWIKDIDLMIRTQEIDWEKIIKEAKDTGFEKMVYLGLFLTKQLFKTPLPQNVTLYITSIKTYNKLLYFILKGWEKPSSTFEKSFVILNLLPNSKARLKYLHNILIKPTFNEYFFIDLPRALHWLYYPLRPYLLMKKYLQRRK